LKCFPEGQFVVQIEVTNTIVTEVNRKAGGRQFMPSQRGIKRTVSDALKERMKTSGLDSDLNGAVKISTSCASSQFLGIGFILESPGPSRRLLAR
jgi:hypothetical protein